jgi:hypothetical protein
MIYTQGKGTSTAKFIDKLRDESYIYRVKVAVDNTLEVCSFCKPDDVHKVRVYGQMAIVDDTYQRSRFRLPQVNIVRVDNNLRTVEDIIVLREQRANQFLHLGYAATE